MKVKLIKPEHYNPDLEPGTEIEVENEEYLKALFVAEAVEEIKQPKKKGTN